MNYEEEYRDLKQAEQEEFNELEKKEKKYTISVDIMEWAGFI